MRLKDFDNEISGETILSGGELTIVCNKRSVETCYCCLDGDFLTLNSCLEMINKTDNEKSVKVIHDDFCNICLYEYFDGKWYFIGKIA